ncbi:MAG TPA: prolyl oligopeptidase family serine peptidase [Steroidobacteraceae bacterium]|nr:prolyl oligopeptidase family serine peptidase [Steroidobacteraceae bacterium]
MSKFIRFAATAAVFLCASFANAGTLKDEMRQPWQRGNTDFVRQWKIAGPFKCSLEAECLGNAGAEAAARPTEGGAVSWRDLNSWGNEVSYDGFQGSRDGAVGFAFATVNRARAGKATLSLGSAGGVRVWVNGKKVHGWDGERSLTADEDRIDVDFVAGENTLLVKAGADSTFTLRVLETGTTLPRVTEIGPSIAGLMPAGFSLNTDVNGKRADAPPVKVEVIAPGGTVKYSATAKRGEQLYIDGKDWADGPYEVRCSTTNPQGLLTLTHLPWYKGDALAKARELAAEAAKADASKPEGFTLKMLVNMVDDRLGVKLADARGNPWPKIHSPLMEFDELMLERAGKLGRIRASGFVRLAWTDETDGSPQYARAYLPANYDPAKKWPMILQMHGFNPANPVYWRWWSADSRHALDSEFSNHQGVIYVEPHGRGNVQYLGFADSDVLRGIAEAKRLFSVDEDRVYLTGDSMGGWGTWNVSTRHPELFAAIAPVFGGVDYHSQMSEEELAKLTPIARFLNEKQSSWSMAESLVNTPILVHHGDVDKAVNVEWSRWGVKLLQRWGYDVRYHEYPGKGHEALSDNNGSLSGEWLLKHRRDPHPRKVRIRSAELRNASAWWARVQQSASPLEFMRVDAEVVDRNVIRLDTDNVLDIVLTPGAELIDASRPVNVVWNGVARDMRMAGGALRLTNANYQPARLHKRPALPGATSDFLMTPFAIVIGTTSKDPDMVALCKEKAQSIVEAWRGWQKVEPRVFLDSEIKDADIARYSLVLIGGADANRVTAKLSSKLPLRINADSVRIDGKEFKARDAAVQMIYPHPQNTDRYVWVFAGTSTGGMYFVEPSPMRAYDWDYVIVDGNIPAYKQSATAEQTRVVSGMFDYNWRYASALSHAGDTEVRAKGRKLKRPDRNLVIDPQVIDSYVGRYQIQGGPVIEVYKDGARLMAREGTNLIELIPESETTFYATIVNARLFFERDAAGKGTGFTGYGGGDFEGKRID